MSRCLTEYVVTVIFDTLVILCTSPFLHRIQATRGMKSYSAGFEVEISAHNTATGQKQVTTDLADACNEHSPCHTTGVPIHIAVDTTTYEANNNKTGNSE